MKQLKIIDQQPSENGIITCNFSMPILIKSGAQITLDKLILTVNEVTGLITLLDQTILLQTNLGETFHSVFIPGATYLSSTAFLVVLTQYLNNALSPFNTEQGLKLVATPSSSSTGNSIVFSFVAVELTELVVVEDNSSIDASGLWVYNSLEPGIGFGIMTEILLKGGGGVVEFYWRPDIVDGTTNSGFSVISQGVVQIQVTQNSLADGSFLISSDLNTDSIIIPSNIFYPDGIQTSRYIYLTQDNGFWRVTIFNNVTLTTLLYSTLTTFPWSVANNNTTRFDFETSTGAYLDVETNPGFGGIQAMVDSLIGSGFEHTVSLDFTNAQQIRSGLGIVQSLITLTPPNSGEGSYTNTASINFSPFRTAGDLSLEMLSLPLENYEVGSSTFPKAVPIPGITTTNLIRMPGARKNVLCYFRPQIIEAGTNIYGFANTTYQWLDLANKLPVEFTSLDFKLFVSSTNTPVKAQSISFNILIKEKDEIYQMN